MTVVDASILVRVLVTGVDDQLLRRRLDRALTLHAPEHVTIEVMSAVRGLLKGSKISRERADIMVRQLREMPISRHPVTSLSGRILDLRENFTASDAAYVALAERLDQPLLTDDRKYERAPSTVHKAVIETYPELH